MKYKVIILNLKTNEIRTTDIDSSYKIENFKRKTERLFGKNKSHRL